MNKKIIISETVIILIFMMIAGFAGREFFPKERIVEVPVEMTAPVMAKIMECESRSQHRDVNGQIKINVNTDKTTDLGIFQINIDTWGKSAGKLGFDLTQEEDNKAFAMYLYKNFGTWPWNSSSKCWSK